MKTLAIYLRTASKDPEAIALQKKQILDVLQRDGLMTENTVVESFQDDGYSGLTLERPGYSALSKRVENREVDAVAVTDLTRIGRSSVLIYGFVEQLKQNGIRLISLSQDFGRGRAIEASGTSR